MTLPPDVLAGLGPLADAAEAVAADLVDKQALHRLYTGDHTLWGDDPTEVADRLGWVPVVAEVKAELAELRARGHALAAGADHLLVMGMGGSSLFPEVLARTFANSGGGLQVHVLDTTDPAAIARMADRCPPARTVHLASSKSGSTIETRSHLEWAWERSGDPARFAVVTDPGSELGELARRHGFADVFENRADIGGRYSALSLFGIVPALLGGVDADALITGGLDALAECGPDADPHENPALALAAAIAAGVDRGRDKLTFGLQPAVATMGLWLEQLLAESLGKDGTGAVPIVGEPLGLPRVYGDDRLFVLDPMHGGLQRELAAAGHPTLWLRCGPRPHDLGHLVVVAELATALVGAAIGVQPFDQPDVAAAKAATAGVLERGGVGIDETPLAEVLSLLQPGDHLAIQAFVDPEGVVAGRLHEVRTRLRDEHRVATSLGFGPRFLHSTGQLHKGGPKAIVCAQVVEHAAVEIPIPSRDFGFGHLLLAQAAGDLLTLRDRGIRAARVPLHELCP